MNLHPAIVHFPIALLVVAALIAILAIFNKKESLKKWMFRNLVSGVMFAPLAIISGIIEEQDPQHNEAIHSVLIIHKKQCLRYFGGVCSFNILILETEEQNTKQGIRCMGGLPCTWDRVACLSGLPW